MNGALMTQPTPALLHQAATPTEPAPAERRMADAVRALAVDATEAARSGHPGLPLRMADAATALWTRNLRFDAADPRWPDRDRFVLSASHGAMLLYALLHLTGYAGMGVDALRGFRRLHSPATGVPEHGEHPAIEATAGPPGQGLAAAVGMALAERMMAARFGRSLVDHRTWVVASDEDLAEGVSHEAADLAGHLRLGKLAVLWDDGASAAGGVPAGTNQLKRFAAMGWATKSVDGQDPAQVSAALSLALRSKRPTLIACRTRPDTHSDTHADEAAPGEPFDPYDAARARAAMDWRYSPFAVPPDLGARWAAAGGRGNAARRAWLKRLARHPLRVEFERVLAGRLPESWHEAMAALRGSAEARPATATRQASARVLEALAPAVPELVGGSADLAPAGMAAIGPGSYGGRHLRYGAREHGMAACLNGLALHGGLIPCGSTRLAFSDHLRPALRLAALMRQRVILTLTDDGFGAGGDGPTCQPVEQLASLRALPGVHVLRPADAAETAECWELALRRSDGPSLLVLGRRTVPALRADVAESRCARGGYVLAEADGPRRATLVATGSEVALAMDARSLLAAEGISVAVVSLPCWELFALQGEDYRAAVLGDAPRIGVEAACGFGWERWLGADGTFIGMDGFGASAPCDELHRHFGITPEAVAAAVRKRLD